MSLQGLISGSECAVPFNPLSQVLKHTEGDRSLQQDRIAGPSSSRLHALPGTSAAPVNEQNMAAARQFFEATTAPGAGPSFAVPPHMPPPELAMQMSRGGAPASQMDMSRAWADAHEKEFMQAQRAGWDAQAQKDAAWAAEFGGVSQVGGPAPGMQQQGFQRPEGMQSPYGMSGMYGMSRPMMGMGMYSAMPLTMGNIPMQNTSLDKGKGKSREIDFDAAFAEVAHALGPSPQETARIEELDDTADLDSAMSGASLESDVREGQEKLGADFQTVWDHMQDSDVPPPVEDIARWEAEWNQLMSGQREDDYGSVMQDAWANDTMNEEKMKFDDEGIPILDDYVFEQENKYLNPSTSTSSYLNDAKALLEQGGSLTEAALMLEAAIQRGDLGQGGYEAWILLGEVRSMDEREDAAMRALAEGVKRADTAGATGEGMLSLAISYTNESYERASHTMLLRWLAARDPTRAIPPEAWKSLKESAWNSHERVTETFINVAREQHAQGVLDADVQIGLGVLFYTNGQYDRAKDCFEAALTVRPNDYLLWNRYGSCLSNGSKPEEALGAYRQALHMRPTYTRAIYNVGVACLNIGAHKEACEHFLSCLAMQESNGGKKSDQLWTTLKRAFLSMDRADLADKCQPTTNLEEFRKEGLDF